MGHRYQHATEIVHLDSCSGPPRPCYMTPEDAARYRALAGLPMTRPAGEEGSSLVAPAEDD